MGLRSCPALRSQQVSRRCRQLLSYSPEGGKRDLAGADTALGGRRDRPASTQHQNPLPLQHGGSRLLLFADCRARTAPGKSSVLPMQACPPPPARRRDRGTQIGRVRSSAATITGRTRAIQMSPNRSRTASRDVGRSDRPERGDPRRPIGQSRARTRARGGASTGLDDRGR